jgi:hypothetical protein
VIPAAAQLKRGAGNAGSICGWLFLFQLAEKANLGMPRNINVNDVASFDLDQFAGIADEMQLRFLILHGCPFLRQFSKSVLSTVWRYGNSRCDRENIRVAPDDRSPEFSAVVPR